MPERKTSFRAIIGNRAAFLGLLVVVIGTGASVAFKAFSSPVNLKSFVLNLSTEAIVSIGMMVLLISGCFDLSAGSVFGLAGAIAARFMYYNHWAVWISVLISFLVCISIGAFNGVLIAKVGVNPLIVTLAMMGLVRGFVRIIAGTGIIGFPAAFTGIASTTILGLRLPIWYMAALTSLFSFVASKTVFFRKYYYIGSNEKAAMLSGMNISRMRIVSFMLMAGLSAFSGITFSARIETSLSTLGNGMELRAITACVLGGASINGGQGSVLGAVIGTLFVGVINNLMIIGKINTYWQQVVTGTILLTAVVLDAVLHLKRSE
jgi:ribose transport system permease protein